MISQNQMEAIIQEVINHCQWMKDKNRPFENINVQRVAERLMKEQNLKPNNRCFVFVQGGVADHVCDDGVEVVTFDFDSHEAQPYKSFIPEHFRDLVEDIVPDDVTFDGFDDELAAAELRSQHARIAELEAQLSAIGAGGVEPLRKRASTADVDDERKAFEAWAEYPRLWGLPHKEVQWAAWKARAALSATPAVALPEPEAWLATFRPKGMLSPHSIAGVNLEELKRQVPSDSVFKPLYTRHASQAQAVAEKAAKYDHLLPYLCKTCGGYGLVDRRCNDDPLGSEPCPDCNAAPQAQADARDVERWMGIGKAIERASADLPEETEIIVSLEKDAGTVTLIDQDGNEHENFSTDYGFAGVLNEAIDAALAAQAKN